MKKIIIEISAGELLDKLSILEIKLNKIKDNKSLKLIKKEYKLLSNRKKISFKQTKAKFNWI